jgi:hypothetical protein
MGARLEEAHGTGGEQHARTNTHAIHTSSLSLSLSLPNKSSSQPFFFLAMFRQKAKLKIENSKMK